MLFHSLDREVEFSILRMPAAFDVESVKRVVVYVSISEGGAEGLLPSEGIDEPTRQVFAKVGDEYGELCDRLFADDPVFSYGTAAEVRIFQESELRSGHSRARGQPAAALLLAVGGAAFVGRA